MSMLNSAPNNKNYKNGLYIPVYKEKIIKLNNQGGLYYRSSLEQKFMIFLDHNKNVIHWNTELLEIPYIKNAWDNTLKESKLTTNKYYPDFYYELLRKDGTISKIVTEVKPYKDTVEPYLKENPTFNQLKNFEYDLKEYSKNMDKWKFCYEWCKKKGYEFTIITEKVPCKLCGAKGCQNCKKGWIYILK